MIPGFDKLEAAEIDQLVEAPVLITALIGAADGELDKEERNWSERLTNVMSYSKARLADFYQLVSQDFIKKVDDLLAGLPAGAEERSELIKDRLSAINPILAKLDQDLAAALYKSFIGLSKETAKASGGFLRIGSISAAEYKWVELPMIDEIVSAESEEKEDS